MGLLACILTSAYIRVSPIEKSLYDCNPIVVAAAVDFAVVVDFAAVDVAQSPHL